MSDLSETDPNQGQNHKPPKRNWEAARKECFFDLKLSHCIEIVLTVALVGIAYFQYEVYKRQAKIMETQTGILRAQIHRANTVDRAWIAPTKLELDSGNSDNKPIKVILSYGNTGHQPAKETVFSGLNDLMIPWDETKGFPFVENPSCVGLLEKRNERKTPGWPFIYPSSEPIYHASYTTKNTTADAELTGGKRVLIVRGCFVYETIGKIDAHSNFCFYLRPNAGLPWTQWQFFACPYGNEGS